MATITTPVLKFLPSDSPDLALIQVTYTVAFDLFDRASDQPYTEVLKVVGDDTDVGDPAAAGGDDLLHTLFLASPIRPSMAGIGATLARDHRRTVPIGELDEDSTPIPNPDEIRVVVTLTPDPPRAVGPTESNLVALSLGDPSQTTISVPNVLGFRLDRATKVLSAVGLRPVLNPAFPTPPDFATVLDQLPNPQTVVDRGSTVLLTWDGPLPQ